MLRMKQAEVLGRYHRAGLHAACPWKVGRSGVNLGIRVAEMREARTRDCMGLGGGPRSSREKKKTNSWKVPGSLSTRNTFAAVHWEKPSSRIKTPLPTKAVDVPWRALPVEVPTSSSSRGKGRKSSGSSVPVGMWWATRWPVNTRYLWPKRLCRSR